MNPLHSLYSVLAETKPFQMTDLFKEPLFMMGIMFVMFYFLLIRPQQMQRKALAARIASIQTGDRVVTNAGIHGLVHNVKDHTVILKVSEGSMIEFDKSAVALVHKKESK
jgi:preprotein translocase subunit YajC